MWCGCYGVFGLCRFAATGEGRCRGTPSGGPSVGLVAGHQARGHMRRKDRTDEASSKAGQLPAECRIKSSVGGRSEGQCDRGVVPALAAGGVLVRGFSRLVSNAVHCLKTACGIRCWITFARGALGVQGAVFPPTVEGILAWSNTFRCSRTFSNYLSYVRMGCLLVGCSTEATHGEVGIAGLNVGRLGFLGVVWLGSEESEERD